MEGLVCPSHKCNIMDLLPILLDINTKEEITLSPSQLNYELQMSTEERLTKLCKPTRKHRIYTEVGTFSRTPDVIVFQNFKSGLMYKTTITFLNLHPVSRHFRVICGNSPYFEVEGPAKDCSAKLAPGMSYALNVTFLPSENRNYIHHITVVTDTESFKVPVYGLGSIALFNLPDIIKLPPTAVNVPSEKSIILHNFGKSAASFVITSKIPFSITPYKHFLPDRHFMELKVICKSSELGHITDFIYFSYEDIKLKIPIECEIYSINCYFDNADIHFEDIYMGLQRQQSVTVFNHSDHMVDFKWKLHKSIALDRLEYSKLVKNLEGVRELEKKRCTKLERMNIIDYEGHSKIYDKLFENEVIELQETDELYLYHNSVFTITPLEGQIIPKKSQTFIVSFAPKKNKLYESWAYLDVTGIVERLPLRMNGTGNGPYVSLNVKVLNIGDVFLCATHCYEISVKNEGNIPATIVFKECVTDFDGIIKCMPKKLYLPQQDSCNAFVLSFYSELKGKFIETVKFVVKESEEVIQFVLTGNVVCPLLRLEIRVLNFGEFPFGETQVKQFALINACQVPIEFKILIEGSNLEFNQISFNPEQGIVDAYTNLNISVEVNSSRSNKVDATLKVIMWGSEQYAISIPLKLYCVSPKIKCYPNDVRIKFCFLNFEYKRTITLKNEDSVPGLITYTPPMNSENGNIKCTLSNTEFVIDPYEVEEIELSIITNTLGVNYFPLYFTVAGINAQELCRITIDGQGPVVSYRPEELQFNEITLLQTVTEELILINDSPIPAIAYLTKGPDYFFDLDIEEMEILPDEERTVTVTCYLTDIGKYSSFINVSIHNGESINVKVLGQGVGHSILCEPPLGSEYDAGILLTYQHFSLPIKMTNLGRRSYRLRWTPNQNIRNLKDKLDGRDTSSNFRIKPEYFELPYCAMQELEIQGFSKHQRHVETEFFCYALIDKSSKMELVTSLLIKASFLEPSVSIKKPVLDILVADDDCLELEDQMSVTNDLSVAVDLNVYTNNEYFIVKRDKSHISFMSERLDPHAKLSMMIKFLPSVKEKRYFKQTGEVVVGYMNHPNSVKLEMNTEVCFPTICLNESELEFNCVPLHSYAYKKIILKNITFLPAKYSWQIIEEFFELENLPCPKRESIPEADDYLIEYLPKSSLVQSSMEVIFDKVIEPGDKNKSQEKIKRDGDESGADERKSIRINWKHSRYQKEMRKILFPTVQKFTDDCYEQDLFEDTGNKSARSGNCIKDILTIEPFQGQLEPYEYGIITIGFFPPPNTRIKARAVCKVEGGEQETLSIVGTSSKISYEFDKRYVEFGCKLFCEVCENSIILTNNGFCEFTYTLVSEFSDEAILEPGWLKVTPKTMKLYPNDSITLKIKYFPGVVGEFNGEFTIVMGYLEPFEIKMHGYAVFSQVYVHIPRPLIREQPLSLLYGAISTLSMHYIHSLEEMCKKTHALNQPLQRNSSQLKTIFQQLDDEWVLVTKYDPYPSTVDIDMSVERLLLELYLPGNADTLTPHILTHMVQQIPGFEVPPYLLDFGHVIVEKPVCYTVLMSNYGPTVADISLMKDTVNLDKNKIKIEYQHKKLNVGETTHLYVIFQPTLKRFTELDATINEEFSLVVSHGATIPIQVRAIVTVPRLSFEYRSIDFGTVTVGYCLRKSVLIKNEGHVLSKWNAECKKKNIYFVRPTEGELRPGKRGTVDIYFKPTAKDFLPGRLNIYVEGSPNKATLDLYGYGIDTNLILNPTDLQFSSTLPFVQSNTMVLKIENISSAPVEFTFTDFDQQYQQEKFWINTYFNCHHVNCVLIPQRNAGAPLHNIFQDNFLKYAGELRKKMIDVKPDRLSELEQENLPTEDPEDPLLKYSTQELEKMIYDYVETKEGEDFGSTDMHNVNEMFGSNMIVIEPEVTKVIDAKKPQSGIFIIFHGGPNTEYFSAANRAGRKLNVPVYSIDRLIYETLLEKGVKCADNINILLNETFDNVATLEDLITIPEEDEYDILMRKVYVSAHNKMPKSKKKGGKEKPEKNSKTSDKSSEKRSKKDKEPSTLINIPVELFEDLLKYKFKSFPNGVIIESLHSEFLRKTVVALYTLLRGMGYSRYIQVIVLSNTLQDYINFECEKWGTNEILTAKNESTISQRDSVKPKIKTKNSREASLSEKSSKKQMPKKRKPSNLETYTLKQMDKELKDAFEAFQELLNEIIEIFQFWDKKECTLVKNSPKLDAEQKDTGKDIKSSQQKKNKSTLSFSESAEGIFLWIINNASKQRLIDFSEIISEELLTTPELEVAKKDLSEKSEEEDKETSVLFTMLTKLQDRSTGKSDFFSVSNYEEEKAGESQVSPSASLSSMTTRSASKKKTGKHYKRNLSEKSLVTGKLAVTEREFIFRHILQPKETQFFVFTFCPKKCGEYETSFLMYVTGSNSNYLLRCQGICELPSIDLNPHVLYPHILENYRDKVLNKNFVYIKEMNILDFGLVFIDPEKPFKYSCKLLLRNISNVQCEIMASLDENIPYYLPLESLVLNPGQEDYLTVCIKPTKTSMMQTNLCISTKNNPKSYLTTLVTKPCKLDFHIKPKTLSFDKVPVHCTISRKLNLTNLSPTNLLWRLVDIKWALQVFDISKMEGTLSPFSVYDITFSYTPIQEEVYSKKQIGIQVFDPHHSLKFPLYVDYVTLHADAIEYQVEYSDHIDLGEIKGRMEYKIPFNLMNKGPFNINITFAKINNPLDKNKHIRTLFELKNTNEILYSNKLFTGNLVFKPTKPMEFKEVPVFVCNFIENNPHVENVLNSFVMKVSAKVYLTSFEVYPLVDLNFGYQQIFSTKKQMMEIKNTGKFPFTYTIASKEVEVPPPELLNKGQSVIGDINKLEKGSKKSAGKKSRESRDDKKIRPSTAKLNLGCFYIQTTVGKIMPYEQVQVEIECIPQENKEYRETVIICVSEPQESDVKGKQIILAVTGCEPLLNFDDINKMFREQYIIDKLENLSFSNTIGSHCIYESSEQTLHFKKVSLNTKSVGQIYLQNAGRATAHVVCKIEDSNKGVFKVSPQNLEIPPFITMPLSIVFQPDCVGESTSKLEITYNASTNNKFLLILIGEGSIPKIRLIDPKTHNNQCALTFEPTYIGHSTSKKICIQNVASVPATGILEICNNTKEMLILKACEDTYNFLNICDLEEFQNSRYSTLVNLQPLQVANFDLIYEPVCDDDFQALIKIHTVNNPFEIIEITVNAESYYHDICLEGLTPYNYTEKNVMGYEIQFGLCFVSYLQKKVFSIKNYSTNVVYKFEFTNFGPLMFTPRIGHLNPLSHKEIIVTFYSKSPKCFEKELVDCTINRIVYTQEDTDTLSWDDRQQCNIFDFNYMSPENASFIELKESAIDEEEILSIGHVSEIFDSVKKNYNRPEPSYDVIPEASEVIPCVFSILTDYASYVTETRNICFPDTYINQKNEAQFKVENNGLVPLEIKWNITEYDTAKSMATSTKDETIKTSHSAGAGTDDTTTSVSAISLCSCSCVEEHVLPFTITPQKTVICQNQSQEFLVRFTPLNLSEYSIKLHSNITCLNPEMKNITIKIRGRSLLPRYYFELDDTDYLSRRPHSVKKCGTIDPINPKIIEFESVGIGTLCLRKCNLVNPTEETFSFKFDLQEPTQEQYLSFSYFDCRTPSGSVLQGKKFEIIFVFKPQEFGHFEKIFTFQIPETDIIVPFLLAGKCRPPNVYFTKTRICMKPTVLNIHSSTTAVLRNDENKELSFQFFKETFLSESQDQELEVTPKRGKLKPNSEKHIKFIFKAEKDGEVNFNLKCAVEELLSPLTLNISAQCTEVLSIITYCEKFDAMTTRTLSKDHANTINFGAIIPKKKEMIKFTISNIGQTGFFYTIEFNSKPIEHMFSFSISSEKHFVHSNKNCEVIVHLEALRKATLKDFKVKIIISYGPTYLLHINAKAETPLVQLSFNTYNFGYCIVQHKKTNYYNVSLALKNIGTRALLLENNYEDSENLTVDFKCSQVHPSCSQHVTMYFHPQNVGHYEINVPLKVNSMKYVVKITGDAVKINLQLANTSDKYIDLGGVLVGNAKQYVVEVINRTPTQVNAFFDFWQRLPFHNRPMEKLDSEIKVPEVPGLIRRSTSMKSKIRTTSKQEEKVIEARPSKIDKKDVKKDKNKNKNQSTQESNKNSKTVNTTEKVTGKESKKSKKIGQDKKSSRKQMEEENVIQDDIIEVVEERKKKTAFDFLKIIPRDCMQLGPDKKHKFIIDFMPTERIENFSEQIFYEVQEHIESLCVVKGSCLAPNFVLSEECLTFSNVVIGLKHTLNVLLQNTGDFKGRFEWVVEKSKEEFKIQPSSGFVASFSEIAVSVTFEPKLPDLNIRTMAKCVIAGLDTKLELELEASSTKLPTPLSTLNFNCPVREIIDQTVKIVNTSKEEWKIYPMLSCDQFSIAREIIVDSDSEYMLNITYNPELTTTLAPHNATLFLPLPEGKAIIYKLIGHTLPPLAINKIKVDVKCKANHQEILPVRNWLNTKQCFNVRTELASPVTTRSLYKASGNPLIELFPNGAKNYNWNIYIINEMPLDFKVIFTNVENNEYMFYEISVNALPPDSLQTINVQTCVRKPVDFAITLENPIDYAVGYTIDCDIPESTFDEYVIVEPYSTHKLSLQYCPLKCDQITRHLNATCPELGTYSYCLNLTAKPPLPENTVKFKAELGEKVSKSIIWKNTFKAPVEFSWKFDHPVFSMERISILEGETGRIKFSFEPSELGVLHSKAIIFSPYTGNYIYPLLGECVLPTPKGPYSIKPGGSTLINFLNPFMEDQTFNFHLHSTAFYLKQTSETVKAKKSTKIVVNLQPLKNLDVNLQSCEITGKLYVKVADSQIDNLKWVYYLQSDM